MKIRIELTKKGYPALWEGGGGYTNTGDASIVCNKDGSSKKPVYIRRKGHLANMEHALFIVDIGDIYIIAEHHRRDFNISVYRIISINREEKFAEAEKICCFSEGEWDVEPPQQLEAAIEAAKKKATCYHCREPHYYLHIMEEEI